MEFTRMILDADGILTELILNDFNQNLKLHILESVDSTNDFLKKLAPSEVIDICCAEMQTAGRGRFNRHWYSPFGENIYCSLRSAHAYRLEQLTGLGLVIGLATVAALVQIGLEDGISIKWPNDVYWQNKKLSGSLIELVSDGNEAYRTVIGVGINVNSMTTHEAHVKGELLPDKPWCSVYDIKANYTDRNLLIAYLIVNLENALKKFIAHGLEPFFKKWQQLDYLKYKLISVSNFGSILSGKACGINNKGQLILLDADYNYHYLSAGDSSIVQTM